MREKLLYKIKKFILPDFKIGEDFDFILSKIIQLFEIFALIIFSFILIFDLFLPFNEYSTYFFIFGFCLSILLKSINIKNLKLKINIFIILLFSVCIFSNLFETYFYLYYFCLVFYTSIFKDIKTSLFNLLISILLMLIIANFINQDNFEDFDKIYNIIFPRVIFVFTFISFSIILFLNETVSLLKSKVDLSLQQSGELTTKEIEQEKLIEKLRKEAEEREKIQKKLEFSKFRYKIIFDNVLDYIVIHKKNGQIVGANNAAIEKYGFDKDNLFNYNKYDFISEKYLNLKDERVDLAIEQESLVFESEHIDKNGNLFYTDNKLKVVVVDDEEYFVTISRDISDRKKKEEKEKEIKENLRLKVEERTAQLEDAMKELRVEIQNKNKTEHELIIAKDELIKSLEIEKEYSELKSRFVSMISHEYRTPLTGIMSYTYILERYFEIQDKENFKTTIEKIHRSINAMTNLLEDVLKIGKSDTEIAHVKIDNFDVISIINEVIKEISYLERIPHNYIIESEYKFLKINSDENLLIQILRNLINNSTKYSEKDTTITICLEINNNTLIIKVIDEGIGIPESDLIHLYEPFFRSGNVGAREGTGLGLALVKKYVEALSGTIKIESELKKGTTIKLTFPVRNYIAEKKD